jgi:MFS family permease
MLALTTARDNESVRHEPRARIRAEHLPRPLRGNNVADSDTEWTHGWRTVASGAVGVAFMTAIPTVTGVVMTPLMNEFGWSRALITANVMLCALMTLLLAPLLGRLISRYGPRRCALGGILGAIPALLLIAMSGGSSWTWLAAWFIFAVINLGMTPMVWSSAVAGLFDRGRGTALAITLSGSGVAYFIFPWLAVEAVKLFGWRGVYCGMALLLLVVVLPLTWAWFRGAADLHVAAANRGRSAAATLTGMTPREAMRTRHFWQFIVIAALMALVEGALQVHLYPILHEGGLAPQAAAWVFGLMGIAMIFGRMLIGFLQDRLPPVPVFALSVIVVMIGALLARSFTGDAWLGSAVAICLGLGSGGTLIGLAYLTSRYFGLLAYPSIYGLVMGGFSLGYGIAPVVAGHVRETTGSYMLIFNWLAAALFVAALLIVMLGRPKLSEAPA